MVKAPILPPTPPSSTSLSPTNEDQQVKLIGEAKSSLSSASSEGTLQSTHTCSNPDDQNANTFKKVKIRIDDLVMADSEPAISGSFKGESEKESADEIDNRTVRNGNGKSDVNESVQLAPSKTNCNSDEFKSFKISENPKATISIMPATQFAAPITVGMTQSAPLPQPSMQTTAAPSQQQMPQMSSSQAPPGPHHPHPHLFPLHVISIPPPPHGTAAAAAVTGAWPLVEAPIYVDSNGEPRHYCPAHSQGPAPGEHRVLLQLDAGVSLPLQIAGKRKVFRGE